MKEIEQAENAKSIEPTKINDDKKRGNIDRERLSTWIIVILFFASPLIIVGVVLAWTNIFPGNTKDYESCEDYSKRFPMEVRKQAYEECLYDSYKQDPGDIYAP